MAYARAVSWTRSMTSSDEAIELMSFSTSIKEPHRFLEDFDSLKSGSDVSLPMIQNRLCNSFHIIGLSAHIIYAKICLAASRSLSFGFSRT